MTFKSWLWPDHAITKSESRILREEHNALVNSHAELLEALKACKTAVEDGSKPPSARMELVRDFTTLLLNNPAPSITPEQHNACPQGRHNVQAFKP